VQAAEERSQKQALMRNGCWSTSTFKRHFGSRLEPVQAAEERQKAGAAAHWPLDHYIIHVTLKAT